MFSQLVAEKIFFNINVFEGPLLMDKLSIKNIIADILFLENSDSINDDTKIFTELALNSIDFIDLVFELKSNSKKNLTAEELWPFQNMLLNPQYFHDGVWTASGLEKIRKYMNYDFDHKISVSSLYPYFTVDYIYHIMNNIVEG